MLSERRYELAAEGRDVRDDVAPDRVRSGRETSEYISDDPPCQQRLVVLPRLVYSRVWREAREDAKAATAAAVINRPSRRLRGSCCNTDELDQPSLWSIPDISCSP
jgi:hypothetical protein